MGGYAQGVAARLVSALVLSMGIGLALGTVSAFTPPGCWIVLGALAVLRASTNGRGRETRKTKNLWPYALGLSVVAFLSWPSLISRPTDGDTLIYHLPNAAAWLHARSIWTTDAHYWWYPPGSELLAAVLIAVGGAFAIPVVGMLDVAALCFALYEAIAERTAHTALAIGCALAFVSSHVAAVQAGDLQNDCLLSAVLIVALTQRDRQRASASSVAGLALIKLSGWIYAIVALITAYPKRKKLLAFAIAPIACWWLRNVLIARAAPQNFPTADAATLFATSIAAHGAAGFTILARSAYRDGVTTLLFVACAFASVLAAPRSYVARAAVLSLAVWVCAPYSFESGGILQLATGSALRFGLPAMATGAIAIVPILATLDRRIHGLARILSILFIILTAINLYAFFEVYRTFRIASFMPWVLCLGLLLTVICSGNLFAPLRLRMALVTAAAVGFFVFAGFLRENVDLVGDYSWAFHEEQAVAHSLPAAVRDTPATVVTAVGFSPGILYMLKPAARVVEAPDGVDLCTFARATGTTVFVHRERVRTATRCAVTRLNDQDFEIRPRAMQARP